MVFVCADCTGHGVPGAFMSMIGSTLLTEICQGDSLLHASEILEELDHRLKLQLDQSGGTDVIKDGMDLSIVIYRPAARRAEVASARRPIYFRHADSLSELKGVKRSIGDRDEVSSRLPFETVSLPVESGDALYVCTDGFQDQFGGLKKDGGAGKRLKNAGVKEWIDDVRDLPIEEQGARLELRIRQWMDGYAQVDDITMLGLQF
jgi:serine phosphatase RsbU (regulator of sigma subunit)